MYPQKFSQSVVSCKPNLKNIADGIRKTYLTNQTIIMIRQKFNDTGTMKSANKKIYDLIVSGKLYKLLKTLPKPATKQNKQNVFKIWAHHCECVLAQRLRRCQQMFCLYSRWWEERALKDFIKRMRQSLARKGKELALGAVGVSAYNWKDDRIPLEDIKQHQGEFDYVQLLKENTICMLCDPSSKTTINTSVCECGTAGKPDTSKSYDQWVPYLERDDLVVWRRPHPSGLYEYKKLFANRDYVFKRRYLIDEETNMLYIVSRSTEFSKYPPYKEKFRVEDYWSRMIIRPHGNNGIKDLGIEFTLTYFDNPGVNIPSSVMTWVTLKAMPDFLTKLRQATREYKNFCRTEGTSEYCRILLEEERAAAEKEEKEKLDYCNFVKLTENIRRRTASWTSRTGDANEPIPELNPDSNMFDYPI
ncbi:unnamed protein product [Acanthoscelides obtectus]|uniref:START domain-containing protein n=1 Tax=Acanthoscelides obtectus TaxID=200917 RepID=A0A9P0PX18_ACAOB|nr:unnamed protein product [Acanthoscelides obtectus]CAK1651860.1 StAR-related lipid transfer protein 7, mitochondrial [Acanthoscelides obtectus]